MCKEPIICLKKKANISWNLEPLTQHDKVRVSGQCDRCFMYFTTYLYL